MYYPVKTIEKSGKVVERYRRMHTDLPQPKDALQRLLDKVMVEDEVIALSEATNAYLLNNISFYKIRKKLGINGLLTENKLSFEQAVEDIKEFNCEIDSLLFYKLEPDDNEVDCVFTYLTTKRTSAVRKFYLDCAIQDTED